MRDTQLSGCKAPPLDLDSPPHDHPSTPSPRRLPETLDMGEISRDEKGLSLEEDRIPHEHTNGDSPKKEPPPSYNQTEYANSNNNTCEHKFSNDPDPANGEIAADVLKKPMELEEALGYLASRKLWHFLIFFAIACFDIPFAFNLLSPVFLNGEGHCFRCRGDHRLDIVALNSSFSCDTQPTYIEGVTVSEDQCSFTIAAAAADHTYSCQKFWYSPEPFGETATTQFDLVCDKSRYAPLTDSIFYVGVLLGSCFTNYASDRWGRKWVVLGALLVQAVFGFAMGFLPYFWVYMSGRLVQGLVAKAVGYVSYVMCLEFLPISIRTFYGVAYNVVWVSGYCMLGAAAYFCRDWKDLTRLVSAVLVLFVGHIWFLPESPQFQAASGKVEAAMKTLEKGCKINRLPLTFKLKPSIEESSNDSGRIYTPLDLIRTPKIRTYFLMVSFLWFSNNLAYYMLSLASTRWGGNIYISYSLGGVVELPAYALSFLLAEWIGRKWVLVVGHGVLSVFCIALGFMSTMLSDQFSWLVILVGVSCKFCVGITFSILLLVGTEIFPTVVRGMAVGMCTLLGDVGSVMAPLIFLTAEVYRPLPYMLVGAMSGLAGLLSMCLISETWHRPLPVTIQDTEDLHRTKAITRKQIRDNDFHQKMSVDLGRLDTKANGNAEKAAAALHT